MIARSLPNYVYDYCAEVFFLLPNDSRILHHRYITYNQKLKGYPVGFKKEDYSKFNLKAWAKVPLSSRETLDLSIYQFKNNEIEDFTVHYRAVLDKENLSNPAVKISIPLKEGYTQSDIHTLNIRSDYGHKDTSGKIKHTNIDIFDIFNNKINTNGDKSFIRQNFEIYNFASTIGYVFMQAEKTNPLVGARYWLSQLGTDENKVEVTFRLWKDSGVSIPLCLLSNNVYVKMIERSNINKREILGPEFHKIVKSEIELSKKVESENSDNIIMHKLDSLTDLFILPFPFFVPTEGFRYGSFKYDEDGHRRSDGGLADMRI
jgi:hypothetical protein